MMCTKRSDLYSSMHVRLRIRYLPYWHVPVSVFFYINSHLQIKMHALFMVLWYFNHSLNHDNPDI